MRAVAVHNVIARVSSCDELDAGCLLARVVRGQFRPGRRSRWRYATRGAQQLDRSPAALVLHPAQGGRVALVEGSSITRTPGALGLQRAARPNGCWPRCRADGIKFIIRDRDAELTAAFHAVFTTIGIWALKTRAGTPTITTPAGRPGAATWPPAE